MGDATASRGVCCVKVDDIAAAAAHAQYLGVSTHGPLSPQGCDSADLEWRGVNEDGVL